MLIPFLAVTRLHPLKLPVFDGTILLQNMKALQLNN